MSVHTPEGHATRSIRLLVSSMSAGGRSISVGPAVVRALRAGGWSVSVTVTTSSDDPRALASSARENVVGALGGDGFLSAVARGCHESKALFAPIPGGRGNDLCRALNVGPDPLKRAHSLAELGMCTPEAERVLNERTMPLDGVWVSDESGEPVLVLGVISLGIDARANVLANESFLTNGPLAYGYGAFAALTSFRPAKILARVDGVRRDLTGWLASVSNSGCIGGGVKLVPTSKLHDGRIELCHAGPYPLRRVLPTLATIVAGRAHGHPLIEVEDVETVEFLEPTGMPAMADGDQVATIPFVARRAEHVVDVLV